MIRSLWIFLFITTYTFAQDSVRTIDLDASAYADVITLEKPKLSQFLIASFTEGKIPGYQSTVSMQPVWGQPIQMTYDNFVEEQTYYTDDVITFDGNNYRALEETRSSPRENPDAWESYVATNQVGEKLHIPDQKDLMTPEAFKSFAFIGVGYNGSYDKEGSYFTDEIVFYEGRCYKALKDSEGKIPTEDKTSWKETDCNLYATPDMIDSFVINECPVCSGNPTDNSFLSLRYGDKTLISFRMTDVINLVNK